MSAYCGAGGVALNRAYCGSLPCAYRSPRVRVVGNNEAMPVAYCDSNTSDVLA